MPKSLVEYLLFVALAVATVSSFCTPMAEQISHTFDKINVALAVGR